MVIPVELRVMIRSAAAAIVLMPLACGSPGATCFELFPVWLANAGREVQMEFDRPFAIEQGQILMMDVFRPADMEGPTPVVVLIHGGFWLFGERW